MSDLRAHASMGDQADGLRRLIATPPVTLEVAARETDVIDAYARIKRVANEQCCSHFRVAITHARSEEEAQSVFANLQRVAREYLGVCLEYLGRTGTGKAAEQRCPAGMARRDSVI